MYIFFFIYDLKKYLYNNKYFFKYGAFKKE